ncbi:hypothetical protein F4803DRAFT_566667 [Xylaria telfairii]|nr:hypothetical protein F4803DRAFT_566667 [Xylaria telfairii]
MADSYSHETLVEGMWQERWGVKFKWTSEHTTPQQLETLIHSYDRVATEAVERLDDIAPPHTKAPPKADEEQKPCRDKYELLQEYASKDEKIKRLWIEVNTVPEWVDWDQIERGQKIFFRYGGPATTALTLCSLIGGMAFGRAAETLDRTGGFDVKTVRHRLLQTTQHTINVHRDLKSIQPGGDGFVDSLHAAVRRRIMQMALQRPEYYDVAKYGVPINDLDSIITLCEFSTAIMWVGLPRQGIFMRQQEIVDYLALWRYVAYIMGAPHDWMATPELAKRMTESLILKIQPSPASANLANNIITGLGGRAPTYSSREFMCALAYWLVGRDLSEKLEIDRPSLYYFSLVLGQCLLFMTICYVNRSFAWLDERNINASSTYLSSLALLVLLFTFNTIFLEDTSKGGLGYKSRFLFKYIPQFDKMSTERGATNTGFGVRKPGIERRALLFLISFSTLAVIGVWYCYKVLTWALRQVF